MIKGVVSRRAEGAAASSEIKVVEGQPPQKCPRAVPGKDRTLKLKNAQTIYVKCRKSYTDCTPDHSNMLTLQLH